MYKIKRVKFYIERKSMGKVVDSIYSLVRSNTHFIMDQKKVFATKLREIITIMKTWGWQVSTDKAGNLVSMEYVGSEPLDNQRMLFEHIAENVQPGCFIKLEVDNRPTTWVFDGKGLIEQ